MGITGVIALARGDHWLLNQADVHDVIAEPAVRVLSKMNPKSVQIASNAIVASSTLIGIGAVLSNVVRGEIELYNVKKSKRNNQRQNARQVTTSTVGPQETSSFESVNNDVGGPIEQQSKVPTLAGVGRNSIDTD